MIVLGVLILVALAFDFMNGFHGLGVVRHPGQHDAHHHRRHHRGRQHAAAVGRALGRRSERRVGVDPDHLVHRCDLRAALSPVPSPLMP